MRKILTLTNFVNPKALADLGIKYLFFYKKSIKNRENMKKKKKLTVESNITVEL